MRIAIVDVLGSPYDGSTPYKRGLGGSESSVVYAAKELAKLGITVHVYNDCESMDAKPGIYDGVDYRPLGDMLLESLQYDVAIVSRSVKPFYQMHRVRNAKFRVLWMHDTFCDGDDQVESLVVQGVIDEIWTLSDWHTTYISQCTHGHRRMAEVLKRKIWVTRNGVNLWRQPDFSTKSPNHFVFNSAVSKGMETLLNDVWPRVRQKIPSAHLTVIGGAYPLINEDIQHDKLKQLTNQHAGRNGVTFTGMITQEQVANHLAYSSFMIYPQSFPETFGISTVESLAYGTPVISGRFGAMEETAIEDACYLMDYPVDSNVLYTFDREAHIERFVNLVVKAWDDQYLWMQKAQAALKVREVCTWDKIVLQWKQHLYKKLGLYLPKDEYLAVQRINHRTHEIFNKRWSNPEEWGFYPESENPIYVVVPFYNASQYLKKCVESIVTQNYENWHLILVDDASTDGFGDVNWKSIPDDKLVVIRNGENRGALANQVRVIDEWIPSHPGFDPIVMLIDGDDALVNDPNIFKKINQLYHDGAEFTYGSCWSMVDNIPLVAQEYPKEVIEARTFRDHQFAWRIPYTHLRTFKRSLFDLIDLDDLCDNNREFFKASGDTALFYSLIEQANPNGIRAVKDIIYLYNDAHPNNDYKINNKEQIKNQQTIMSRKKSIRVEDLENQDIKAIELAKPKKKVLIAIPTDRNIYPITFKSIYDLQIPEGYTVDFQYFHGYRVDQVRNLIADWVVNGYDYLFSVDYDISFPPDTLSKLLSHDKPFVTGLYIQRIPEEHNLELYRLDINGAHYRPTWQMLTEDLEPIDGCGFGCVLIKSEVLKAVGYPQFEYHHALRMEDTISEDVDFCNKAREKGFEIFADTTIRCGHHGQTVFEV